MKPLAMALVALGVVLVCSAILLYLLTDLAGTIEGLRNIALVAGAGLLLLVPGKIVLTLLLMGEHNRSPKS